MGPAGRMVMQSQDGAAAPPRFSAAPSFEAFYASEYARVVVIAAALTGSRQHAEEIAQETFVRTYLRWSQVAVMDHPAAWVRRVAVNLATSRLRRWKVEARALTRFAARASSEMVEDAVDGGEEFWAAVRRLPPRQAAAAALHYADDLAVADIAVVMGCAEGTVKAHLHAARGNLARVLDEGATA